MVGGSIESQDNIIFTNNNTRSDTCAAILLETYPRFEPAYPEREAPRWPPYSSLATRYITQLTTLTGKRSLSLETVDVYWSLRNLAGLKEQATLHNIESIEIFQGNIAYSDVTEDLERRLIDIIQSEMQEDVEKRSPIFTLFAYAAILQIYLFQRDLSKTLPFFSIMARRIRAILELQHTSLSLLKRQYPDMIMWILILAGICSGAPADQEWFARLVADFCLEAGIRGSSELMASLGIFFWSEFYRSPMTIGFWTSVASKQGLRGEYTVKRLKDHAAVAVFNVLPDSPGT